MSTKHGFRKLALARREQLPIGDISAALCTHLGEWTFFQQARQVLFYFPYRHEVDLRPLFHRYPEKDWYLPTINPAIPSQGMIFRLAGAEAHLSPGCYGILEPPAEAVEWAIANRSPLLLVPGLLFDPDGYRLGYGKGYYDRFFSQPHVQSAGCIKVGIAPSDLIQPALPHDRWDVPMDFMATELGITPTRMQPA